MYAKVQAACFGNVWGQALDWARKQQMMVKIKVDMEIGEDRYGCSLVQGPTMTMRRCTRWSAQGNTDGNTDYIQKVYINALGIILEVPAGVGLKSSFVAALMSG